MLYFVFLAKTRFFLIHGPGHPEWKKSERIFKAIPNFDPKRPGSAAYPPPREVHPDSSEGPFPQAICIDGAEDNDADNGAADNNAGNNADNNADDDADEDADEDADNDATTQMMDDVATQITTPRSR
jgi:hypothetical protein